ncbi:serine/threonine protein kinase [bacterium]|nr:serine/threonine protein kinase [candidate division CSSED10-310 bacterium]
MMSHRSELPEKKEQTDKLKTVMLPDGKMDRIYDWVPGQKLLNEYIVDGYLGHGGMGTVYLVRQRSDTTLFAVKTLPHSVFQTSKNERMFLRELRTWISLPDHPNITACRFFRTIDNKVAIFAEYVDGGSLKSWIEKDKTTEISRILDIAIQIAWGLEVAHKMRIIHQDIKPSNILMSETGIPKVTDFGLAQARYRTGIDRSIQTTDSADILVSTSGMTIAYCSPEQASGQKVTRKTDIWSYGLTILEMFVGRVTWQAGYIADMILDNYLASGPEPPFPRMPDGIVEILRRCFREKPEERWRNFSSIANRLKEIYKDATGSNFERAKPDWHPILFAKGAPGSHSTLDTSMWKDPIHWIEYAKSLVSGSHNEYQGIKPVIQGPLKAQMISDLELFRASQEILEHCIQAGNSNQKIPLAHLLADKAIVHSQMSDYRGSIDLYDKAIDLIDSLDDQLQDTDIIQLRIKLLVRKASALHDIGNFAHADSFYDQAIEIFKSTYHIKKQTQTMLALARFYSQKASNLMDMQQNMPAIRMIDQAIPLIEKCYVKGTVQEISYELSQAYLNKALMLSNIHEYEDSVDLFKHVITIREELVYKNQKMEYAPELCLAYMNYAITLKNTGQLEEAITLYDKCIILYEDFVGKGNFQYRHHLAHSYMNKGIVLKNMGRSDQALQLYDKAITVREHLVYKEGQTEYLHALALLYMNKAIALKHLKQIHESASLYDKALSIWLRLVNEEKQQHLWNFICRAYCNQAEVYKELSRYDDAIHLCDKTITIWKHMIERDNRTELLTDLALLYVNKGLALRLIEKSEEAVEVFERSIQILSDFVYRHLKKEWKGYLGLAIAYKACALMDLGKSNEAAVEYHAAHDILEKEIERTQKIDFKNAFIELKRCFEKQ